MFIVIFKVTSVWFMCVSMHMMCVLMCMLMEVVCLLSHFHLFFFLLLFFPPPPPSFFFSYFEKGSFTDLAILAGQKFQGSSCLYLPSTRVVDMCHHTWLFPRVLGIQISISSALLSTLVMSLTSFLLSIDWRSARYDANAEELAASLPLKMEGEPNMKKSLF